ncbi:hypothetical protein JW979_12000, partial [bacterium]|nr:hypothetical protein [candidate division CSSED10-310 bacterium]
VRWVLILLGMFVIGYVVSVIRNKRALLSQPRSSSNWFVIRVAVYCLLPPFILTSFLHLESLNILEGNPFLMKSIFYSTLFICLNLWSLWVLRLSRRSSLSLNFWGRGIDILCMNLMLLLFLGELFLIIFSHVRPSILFYSHTSDILTRIDSLHWGPGAPYFNFHMNSRGYHDEEFFRAEDLDLVIGLLADSFGLGVVPYEYNFATVAERKLREYFANTYNRIAIHNFGVPGIAMEEYAFLLETQVLQTNPALVVLCIFIGNDIIESQEFDQIKQSRYCFQNWFLWLVPKRLVILAKEQKRQELNALKIGQFSEETDNIPDYIYDSSKERPTFSMEKFLEIERWRFEVCNPKNRDWQKSFTGFFKGLDYFQTSLGKKLVLVLLPDEFQVNDELYNDIKKFNRYYSSYQRDYPQERILAYCQEHGIVCIDMLPALREGQKNGRTYHLQDTHLNTYGNSIVGKELAEALYKYLNN